MGKRIADKVPLHVAVALVISVPHLETKLRLPICRLDAATDWLSEKFFFIIKMLCAFNTPQDIEGCGGQLHFFNVCRFECDSTR
jgi:hypothetical protein